MSERNNRVEAAQEIADFLWQVVMLGCDDKDRELALALHTDMVAIRDALAATDSEESSVDPDATGLVESEHTPGQSGGGSSPFPYDFIAACIFDHAHKAVDAIAVAMHARAAQEALRRDDTAALRAERRAAIEEAANAIREKNQNEHDGESPNYYVGLHVAEEVVRALLDSEPAPDAGERERVASIYAGWESYAATLRDRYDPEASRFDEGAMHMLDILCEFIAQDRAPLDAGEGE